MKTSITIPVFNEEKYLPACLDSLVCQSLSPDEVIVCDNNSTDRSVAIARSYQSKLPIKVLYQSQKGIIPTIEKAWRGSFGDLIIRTDADCIYPKDWIKNIVSHFNSDPDLAACGGPWRSHDGNFFWKLMMIIAFPLGDLYFPLFKGYHLLVGPNLAIRRSVMQRLNGFLSPDHNALDDQLLSQKLSQNRLKYNRFSDCWNYHSTRRWHQNPKALLMTLLAAVNPRFYQYKKD